MTDAQKSGHQRRAATRRKQTQEGIEWARRWREENKATFAAMAAAGAFAPDTGQ